MSDQPLNPAGNGRTSGGKFATGNKAGRGNPLNRRAQRIRNALLKSANTEDVRAICMSLVEGAKRGDLAFIKEWLDRTAGKPVQSELLERIEAIENKLAEKHDFNDGMDAVKKARNSYEHQ